jgi:sulfite oxidase
VAVPFGKHSDFLVRQAEPFNGGPPLSLLRADFVTPNGLFFVRSHAAVPEVDAAGYRLEIDGAARKPLRLSLAELHRRFPRRELTATLQCAGNRRLELISVAPIPGELPWGSEAVSNARWSGVRLADVLAAAQPQPSAKHVAFSALDECERHGHRFGFGGSIPLAKALASEVLLADEMNGEPLPPVHGAPLRVIVPGYIGARSVKWLERITLQENPSSNYFQSKAYRLFPPHFTAQNVDWDQGLMLGEQSVNAILCHPNPDDTVASGIVHAQGVAMAGGGRRVERVDLSSDGGRSWTPAVLEPDHGPWAWRFFHGTVELSRGKREIVARAWDSAAQTQPEHAAQLWNFKGYMNNAWARVRVLAR